MTTSIVQLNDYSNDYCLYCSRNNNYVFHYGKCPKVKSIEYHPDGTVKKVEFKE